MGFKGVPEIELCGLPKTHTSFLESGTQPLIGPKLSKRVYFAYKGRADMPLEVIRWTLAERFGWTLDYIDALSMGDIHEYLQIQDGRNKARGIGVKVHGEKSR